MNSFDLKVGLLVFLSVSLPPSFLSLSLSFNFLSHTLYFGSTSIIELTTLWHCVPRSLLHPSRQYGMFPLAGRLQVWHLEPLNSALQLLICTFHLHCP